MKRLILFLAMLLCARCISAQSYSTTFPLTENPISESGNWINGGVTGLDWGNVRTTTNLAFGASTSVGCPGTNTACNDPSAVLSGSWGSAQGAQATIFVDATLGSVPYHEVELRLRTTITAHSITGYEINCNVSGQNYFQLVRWNGPLGNFTQLTSVSPGCVNGDVITATAIGSTIKAYKNGVQQFSVTDATYSGGSPGMGFFDSDADGKLALFGFTSYVAYTPNACPAGANYINLANPIGSFVTLASLGVTKCDYVAVNGSDSVNDGASELTPWLHAPGMGNCVSNCNKSALVPGAGIIFRGGDTWHSGSTFSCSAGQSCVGTFPACTNNRATSGAFCLSAWTNGTSSNPVYIGVDPTWFSGGSWTRPILNGDNPLTPNPNVVGDSVASCAFQMGGPNQFVTLDNRKFYIFDNFEMTGLCQQAVGQQGGDVFFGYAAPIDHLYFLNNYTHGVTHLAFAGANGNPPCGPSNVCFNMSVFKGGSAAGPDIIYKHVADFTDSDPSAVGVCKGGFNTVAYSVFKGTSQCITVGAHLFHDNLYCNFIENGHSNVWESNNDADQVGVNAVYNNLFCHLEDVNGQFAGHLNGGVGLWPSPPVGSTDYVFNNLMYAVGNMEIFNVGLSGSAQGQLQIFNNTFQANSNATNNPSSTAILRCDSAQTHPFTSANNHFIIDTAAYTSPCTGKTELTTLTQTNSQANSAGYTPTQTPFVLFPISSGSTTVGVGTNEQSFCTALSTAAGSDPTLSDAASACLNDTTYAGIYNTSNHTVTFPARTATVRPASAAWDKGAYQFSSSGPTQAATPIFSLASGTYLTSQPVSISTSLGSLICFNTTGATITIGGAGSCPGGSTLYTGPIMSATGRIFAVAGGIGFLDSAVASVSYVIGPTQMLPQVFAGNVVLKGSVINK